MKPKQVLQIQIRHEQEKQNGVLTMLCLETFHGMYFVKIHPASYKTFFHLESI